MSLLKAMIQAYVHKKPLKERSAEEIVGKQNYTKIRPLSVEMLYNEVRYQFKENMKNRKLKRWNILNIRKYLEENVKYYPRITYKNDAHAIFTILKSGSITLEQLREVQKMLR